MFLITTADRRFWKTNEQVLFLGEWCKLYSDKEIWNKMDYSVLTYHWDAHERFEAGIEYLEETYEKYLALLSVRLNKIHNVNYSTRYWRIVVGIWLKNFVSALYDRYLSIKAAEESGLVTNTWICSTEPWTPHSLPSFSHDDYNLYLYSRIIKFFGNIPFEEKHIKHIQKSTKVKGRKKSKIGRFIAEIVRHLRKGPEMFLRQAFAVLVVETYPKLLRNLKTEVVFCGSTYLSFFDQVRLQLSLGQPPYLYHGEKITFDSQNVNYDVRDGFSFPDSPDSFEKLLNEMIPEQIPMTYVEHYKEMHDKVMMTSPPAPKIAVTAFTVNYRRNFEFWAAYHSEKNGTKLFVSQHGGGYGSSRYISLDKHILSAYDRYYTWGSTLNDCQKVKPMPSFRLLGSKKTIKPSKENGPIIWLATTLPRYRTTADSGYYGNNMLRYFEDQKLFFDKLSSGVRELLVWRYFSEPWDDALRVKSFAPEMRQQLATKKQLGKGADFHKELSKCRLSIHTTNETTYLETIAADFPTLIFWNSDVIQVHATLQPVFEKLIKVGILHYSPESAARKLNDIYEYPDVWWNEIEVQKARQAFSNALALTSDDWLAQWKKELYSEIKH